MELEDYRKFVKRLTDSDINQKLAVPTEFVRRNALVHTQLLEVIDFGAPNRDRYVFTLSLRRHGLYARPALQARGWRRFVRQNALRAGDTIHFWMLDDRRTFGIQVERDFLGRFGVHPAN